MVFGGLAGTVSGVSAAAGTDRRLVPYGALVATSRHRPRLLDGAIRAISERQGLVGLKSSKS